MSDSRGNGENSYRSGSSNGNHSRPVTPQGQPSPGYDQARQRPGPSGYNGESSRHRNFGSANGNGSGNGHHSRNGNGHHSGNGNGNGHRYGNGSSNGRSHAASPNYLENRAGSSGSVSSNGRPQSHGSNSPGPSRLGEKRGRGRDRSEDSSGGRNKFQKQNSGAAAGKDRKRREEFIDQVVTRPEDMKKQAEKVQTDTIINVVANYFKVNAPEILVTGYRVDFKPETDVPGVRRRLISQNKPRLGGYVYDGGCELFLLRPLGEMNVALPGTTREGQEFTILLKETGRVRYTEARFLQVLNLILRNGMRGLNLQLVGRNFFDANPKVVIDIPEFRLQIWPGYDTSIRQHENGLLLNCDTRHKVMRQENVLAIIRECLRTNGGQYREAAAKRIIGATVLTDYNNATYRISDIDWDQHPTDTFETRTGPVTFAAYYETKYNLQIQDPGQPLLVSMASARNIRAGQPEYILLVPELCRMTGLTDNDRKNFQLMRAMAERTRMTPTERVNRLELFSRRMNDTPACRQAFDENRMQIERNLVQFKARRFEPETLYKGPDRKNSRHAIKLNERADWTRDLQKDMFRTVLDTELKNWFYVYPQKFKGIADDFMRSFMQAANGFLNGRRLVAPRAVQIIDDRTSTYQREVNQIMCEDPSFLMVVIPNKRDEVYSALKKMTIGESQRRPVAIQVVTERTCKNNRNLLSIATKVAIQVNAKLGGIPWSVNLRIAGIMIVGFDISIGKGRKRETYGAMVASLNPENNGGHYFSMAKRHSDGTMLANNFGVMIQAALMRYRKCNEGALPERILIYRDGVGDGDLAFVNDQELGNIRRVISTVYGSTKEESLAFIIVNKKSNTRIMEKGRQGSREPYCNPQPGTVIDDVITMPERIDFYLISQSVNQGTVSPVYYNVLYNTMFPKTRGLQHLSYKLCHNYFNWTGTVRVPSVVQYAKKLAMLSQDTLNGAPSDEIPINQQLYFL